jgi:glycosyltransferase involved in cell wall biosynthesis
MTRTFPLSLPSQLDARPDEQVVPRTRRSLAAKALDVPKRVVLRVLRAPLIAYARGGRRADAEPTVYILLVSAYGMGGTIRAALNLAGHLAQSHRVEIISVYRRRTTSFFGDFPPGVTVSALDDQRKRAAPDGLQGRIRTLLKRCRSILVHGHDRRAEEFTLWTDVQLVRKLRGARGWLITTRPGLNLVAAELSPPGLVTIGQEQMHLLHHRRSLRKAMPRLYPRLDAMAVLTGRDVENYRALCGEQLRLVQIPNTVRLMGGPKADLSEKTILAAGRFAYQKGFDLLLPAFAQITADHPDWRLRLCGSGHLKKRLKAQIAELGLTGVVRFEGPADMSEAMTHASIFAMSSRFEGFPLILLEAMSKGMAVVSFDCPTGPGEIIDDRRNGILVPEQDVDGFAAGLRALIEDEELRRTCGAAAIGTADDYTMESVGPRWDALLEELWRGRAVGGPAQTAPAGELDASLR